MARPRVFKEGERAAINIYLHKEQLDFLKKWAHIRRISPSEIIRNYIQYSKDNWERDDVRK